MEEGQTTQWPIEKGQTTQWPIEEGQTTQWPIEKGQTTQWPIEKGQKNKGRSTKCYTENKISSNTNSTKTRVELTRFRRVSSSCSTSGTSCYSNYKLCNMLWTRK